MERYEATFEVEPLTDAYAVERLLERLYDSHGEESRTLREGTADSSGMLSQFETNLDATRRYRSGRLTVIYEQREADFEE